MHKLLLFVVVALVLFVSVAAANNTYTVKRGQSAALICDTPGVVEVHYLRRGVMLTCPK